MISHYGTNIPYLHDTNMCTGTANSCRYKFKTEGNSELILIESEYLLNIHV